MSSDWYPIIEIEKCKEHCFVCLNFCPQKVFERDTAKPKVANPDACLKGCNSCEGLCPVHAISFITARTYDIDGNKIGLQGVDVAFNNHPDDFEAAFKEICDHNYVPDAIKDKLKKALRK